MNSHVAAGASISACFCAYQKNDDVTRNIFFVERSAAKTGIKFFFF